MLPCMTDTMSWAETMVTLAELGSLTAAGNPVSELTLRSVQADQSVPERIRQRAALCLGNRADAARRDQRAR